MEILNSLMAEHAVLSTNMMWGIFGVSVIVLLALDLFVFNRKNE